MSANVSTPKEGSERKTFTNWSVFEKANLIPVRIKCDGYLGQHPADMSCHSNILNTVESVQHHMKVEHGGGWFHVRMKVADGKQAKGADIWRNLQAAGVEITHLYCPHCRSEVQMTPRQILYHLNAHPGANRVNAHPATLCMSLSYNSPETQEFSEESFD
jgi:hypothetical protein